MIFKYFLLSGSETNNPINFYDSLRQLVFGNSSECLTTVNTMSKNWLFTVEVSPIYRGKTVYDSLTLIFRVWILFCIYIWFTRGRGFIYIFICNDSTEIFGFRRWWLGFVTGRLVCCHMLWGYFLVSGSETNNPINFYDSLRQLVFGNPSFHWPLLFCLLDLGIWC
jgi:hypothetical protein